MLALVLLLLPAITGASSVLWAEIAHASRLVVTCLSGLSYVILAGLFLVLDGRGAGAPGLPLMAAYVVSIVAVSALWLTALASSSLVSIALAEGAYPACALIILWCVHGTPPQSWTTYLGGAMAFVGAVLIAVGEAGP